MTERSEPVVAWEAPGQPVGPGPGIAFAPHGPRIVGYLIDSLILVVVFVASLLLVLLVTGLVGWSTGGGTAGGPEIALFGLWFVLVILVMLGYFPFYWRKGQTPGMRFVHLWVVRDEDGGPLTWRHASLRALGFYTVSGILYLGFVWIFIDKRRRAWHDLIAGTVVIRRQ